MKITKKEKKLLKAAKKLEKATKKYMKTVDEITEIFGNLPTSVTRCYNLEKRFFEIVPAVAIASVKFELLYNQLSSEINNDIGQTHDWKLNDEY